MSARAVDEEKREGESECVCVCVRESLCARVAERKSERERKYVRAAHLAARIADRASVWRVPLHRDRLRSRLRHERRVHVARNTVSNFNITLRFCGDLPHTVLTPENVRKYKHLEVLQRQIQS